MARMPEGRLPVQLLYGEIEGKGTAGRPKGRWRDMIEGDIKKRGDIGWYDMATDRKLWRQFVNGVKVEAAVRRRRKNAKRKEEKEEKEEKESKEKKKAKEADPEGAKLECRKCGRVFKSNRRMVHETYCRV